MGNQTKTLGAKGDLSLYCVARGGDGDVKTCVSQIFLLRFDLQSVVSVDER